MRLNYLQSAAIILTSLTILTSALHANKTNYAVFPVVEVRANKQLRLNKNLTNVFNAQMKAILGNDRILTNQTIQGMVGMSPFEALSTCGEDPLCIAQLGQMIGSSDIVTAMFKTQKRKRKRIYTLTIQQIDSYAASVKSKNTITANSLQSLAAKLRPSIFHMFKLSDKGIIVLELPIANDVKYNVSVDKKSIGQVKQFEVDVGRHNITITSEAFETWQKDINVKAQSKQDIKPDLIMSLAALAPIPLEAITPVKADQDTTRKAVNLDAEVEKKFDSSREKTLRIVGFSLLGASGLTAIGAAASGAMYLSNYNKGKNEPISIIAEENFNKAKSAATASYILWGTTAVLAGAGTALLFNKIWFGGAELKSTPKAAILPLGDGAMVTISHTW